MNSFTEAGVTIVGLIVGVAALSVLLSPKSTTASVIQSAASGLGNTLATAVSPVTGASVIPNLSYPGGTGIGAGLSGLLSLSGSGLPNLN